VRGSLISGCNRSVTCALVPNQVSGSMLEDAEISILQTV
jgi:hypothetical protein